ncbi:hypothetical protein KC901_00160 [Patescibacteria group bacterium]|nr:hypothetical protein [Patescibacteria group bacterium]
MKHMYPLQKNKGFVILFAVLVSSLILLISAGIFNIVQKEVVLSSYARESQRAFYAADSALECALYADVSGAVVTPTGPGTPFSANAPADGVFECAGDSIASTYLETSGGTADYDYPFVFRYYNTYNTNDNSCAYVLVEKNLKSTDLSMIETRITAVGFNICTDSSGVYSGDVNIPDFDNPTLLERRLSIIYTQ